MDTWWSRLQEIDWSRWSGPVLAGLRILLIIVVAWVLVAVLQRAVRALRVRIAARLDGVDAARRAETLDGSRAISSR